VTCKSTGEPGFAKTLREPKNVVARGRFHREVAAYETLSNCAGVPRLLDHNADRWKESESDLFLVTELVEGTTLAARVRHGNFDLDSAIRTALILLNTLVECHALGVYHRDIKPDNVMIRENSLDPVLVDFGLSFNSDEETQGLTVDEKVGNGFLRLPDHIRGGSDPRGDIAQVAGILLFTLTGDVPIDLLDDDGRAPHQREVCRNHLDESVGEPLIRRNRLLDFFDTAFHREAKHRFQTCKEAITALNSINTNPATETDLKSLYIATAELLSSAKIADQLRTEKLLQSALEALRSAHQTLKSKTGLEVAQTGWGISNDADEWTGHSGYHLVLTSVTTPFVSFTFRRSGNELLLTADGLLIWRGSEFDSNFEEAVHKATLGSFNKSTENS
jgi:eukaryotic-like serine/threonine-protein kinase